MEEEQSGRTSKEGCIISVLVLRELEVFKLIQSFHRLLLSDNCVPGSVLGAGVWRSMKPSLVLHSPVVGKTH